MRIRALQDRCVAQKGVIHQYRKCQKIKNKEWDQYKEAFRTLNEELMDVNAKLKDSHLRRLLAEKVKAGLATELPTLREQMDKAKVDAVAEFRTSQPFIDACSVYNGVGFEDCLKQVGPVYPDLDLSKISLNDPIPTTPRGGDTINEESNDSAHTKDQDLKDDGVIIAQPIPVGPITLLVSSSEDSST